MIFGHVRDNFPRISLSLPGMHGFVIVEFVVDTAFDGELALPAHLVHELDGVSSGDRPIVLADGTRRDRPIYGISLDWEDEPRLTEVLVLEGMPLLGVALLAGSLLQAEMRDGGEVAIEPL